MNQFIVVLVEFVLVLISCVMEFGARKRYPNSVEIVHDSDQYDYIRDIGSGNFGVARLMKNKQSDEQVAIKYIERGSPVSCNLYTDDFCLLIFICLWNWLMGNIALVLIGNTCSEILVMLRFLGLGR